MTITVDIAPEVEAELARKAAAEGRDLETYIAGLFKDAAHVPSVPKPPAKDAKEMVELFAPLRGPNIDFERDRDPGRDLEL